MTWRLGLVVVGTLATLFFCFPCFLSSAEGAIGCAVPLRGSTLRRLPRLAPRRCMNQLVKKTLDAARFGGALWTSLPRLEAKKMACKDAGIRDRFTPEEAFVGFVMGDDY